MSSSISTLLREHFIIFKGIYEVWMCKKILLRKRENFKIKTKLIKKILWLTEKVFSVFCEAQHKKGVPSLKPPLLATCTA